MESIRSQADRLCKEGHFDEVRAGPSSGPESLRLVRGGLIYLVQPIRPQVTLDTEDIDVTKVTLKVLGQHWEGIGSDIPKALFALEEKLLSFKRRLVEELQKISAINVHLDSN